MTDLTPITRLEYDLDGIVNNHSLLDPITRVEMYLSDIAAGRTASLSPITRIEMYLAKISGASVEVPAPITRIEMYLAAIAGEDVETPDPITRVEYWLDQWADQSGSGVITTVTGTSPLALANALAKSIRKLIQYGKVTTSNGDMYCNNGKLVAVGDELSVVGTPEVLTIGEQTATVENLFAVDDIKDEQNIISGTVTRRCEAVISDGTTPSGRYIGEVGDGNIIVKVRETGYEGDVATFEADSVAPLNGLTVNVEPIQDLHGYDSPWPAGGGVNLLDPLKCSAIGSSSAYGLTVTHDQATETWTISGTPTSQSASFGFNFCTYSDFSLSGKGYQVQSFLISGTPIKNVYGFRNENENKIAIVIDTVANPTVNMTFKVSVATTSQTAWSPYSNICPISGRTSATIYHSGEDTSDPTTYTIQLGDTVYGGQLDVTGGKMVVDRAMRQLTGNEGFTLMGASSNNPRRFMRTLSAMGWPPSKDNIGGESNMLICNRSATPTEAFGTFRIGQYLTIPDADERFPSANDFNSWLATQNESGSPLQICYPLATPIEITLTPTQIDTLLGQNNVWSDAGTVKAHVADGDVIEHVTAQPMRTAEGSNTVSVTSAVAPVQLSATYTASE